MKKFKKLIFIPENVKFVKKKTSRSDMFLSLQERIKNNPEKRNQILCESMMLQGLDVSKLASLTSTPSTPAISREPSTNYEVQPASTNDSNAPKEYIWNKTGSPIVLNCTVEDIIRKDPKMARSVKPKSIRHCIALYELTEKEQKHPEIQSMIQRGMLELISKPEMESRMAVVRAEEEKERSDLERRKRQAELDRQGNPHKSADTRSIGGFEMNEVSEPVRGAAEQSEVGVTIDLSDSGSGARRLSNVGNESDEMDSLIRQVLSESDSGDGMNPVDPSDMSGIFK